jgi:hypothetical protein
MESSMPALPRTGPATLKHALAALLAFALLVCPAPFVSDAAAAKKTKTTDTTSFDATGRKN